MRIFPVKCSFWFWLARSTWIASCRSGEKLYLLASRFRRTEAALAILRPAAVSPAAAERLSPRVRNGHRAIVLICFLPLEGEKPPLAGFTCESALSVCAQSECLN